jgi:hypothetical protein
MAMDKQTKTEIEYLAAETMALSSIIIGVLGHLAQSDRKLDKAIGLGFDHAANEVENFIIKVGKAIPPEHGVKALRIIEDIRSQALGDHKKPKGIV